MQNYSVLMSVYHKEKPEYLRQAIESIQVQTVPTRWQSVLAKMTLTQGKQWYPKKVIALYI